MLSIFLCISSSIKLDPVKEMFSLFNLQCSSDMLWVPFFHLDTSPRSTYLHSISIYTHYPATEEADVFHHVFVNSGSIDRCTSFACASYIVLYPLMRLHKPHLALFVIGIWRSANICNLPPQAWDVDEKKNNFLFGWSVSSLHCSMVSKSFWYKKVWSIGYYLQPAPPIQTQTVHIPLSHKSISTKLCSPLPASLGYRLFVSFSVCLPDWLFFFF